MLYRVLENLETLYYLTTFNVLFILHSLQSELKN